MNKEIISDRQGINLVALFIMGSTLILGTGAEAGKDAWLAVLLALLISFPMLMVYARILSHYPGKDLFDIFEIILGKSFGKLLGLLYIWFAFHLGALVLRNFGEFIITVSLPETPQIVPIIFVIFLCAWGLKHGIEVISRWGELAIIVLGLFTIIAILLLIPKMEVNNIRPMLSKGFRPVLSAAFSTVSFPFCETVLFSFILSGLKGKRSAYRVYFWGLAIGGIVILLTAFTELFVLGELEYTKTYFPSYNTVSRTNVRGFIQRLEIIPAIAFLGAGFIKISICLLAVCKGVSKVFECRDYRFLITPIALMMLNLGIWIYDSIKEMFQWAFTTWKYYAFPFQVFIPVVILIFIEIKKRASKPLGGANSE